MSNPTAGLNVGIRSWDDTSYPSYGKVGDSFIYASIASNGLNLINSSGTGTEDYIRFYAGKVPTAGTSHVHIQGSGATIGYVGFGIENPTSKVDILGDLRISDNANLIYSNISSNGGQFVVSGRTNIPRLSSVISPYLTKPATSVSLGMRSWDDTTYPEYGKVGDAFLRATTSTNGLNIINALGSGTEDYIRFYAGVDATSTPHIHIQGTGSTTGYVGIGKENPSEMLDIADNVNIDGTLTIGTIGSGTPVQNLGYDISGNVVTGGTVNLSRRTTSVDAGSDPGVNNIEIVFYNATVPGGTIYLNSAMNVAGKEVILIRTSTTNSADIRGSGGELINGLVNKALPTTVYSKVNCISNGTNWFCSSQTGI